MGLWENLFGGKQISQPIAPSITNIGDQSLIDAYNRQMAVYEQQRMSALGNPFPTGKVITHLDNLLERIAKHDEPEQAIKELIAFAKEHTARRVAEELQRDQQQVQEAEHSHWPPRSNSYADYIMLGEPCQHEMQGRGAKPRALR